jgi:hypothetical protein
VPAGLARPGRRRAARLAAAGVVARPHAPERRRGVHRLLGGDGARRAAGRADPARLARDSRVHAGPEVPDQGRRRRRQHLDVDRYWPTFAGIAPHERKGNGALYAALATPLARFTDDLDDAEQDRFRRDLDAYRRAYSFLSQIVTWTDADLEKLYVFARSLAANLPRPASEPGIDLGSEVELTHLRIETRGEFVASVDDSETGEPLVALPGAGSGSRGDPEKERLSAIVSRLNERHGLNLSLTDALLFEQFKGDWTKDPELAAAGRRSGRPGSPDSKALGKSAGSR